MEQFLNLLMRQSVTSETGTIDANLVDVDKVGERGFFPCKNLGKLLYFPLSLSFCIFQSFKGTPVLNMNRCCSFKVGPLDVTNIQKCCLGQGNN